MVWDGPERMGGGGGRVQPFFWAYPNFDPASELHTAELHTAEPPQSGGSTLDDCASWRGAREGPPGHPLAGSGPLCGVPSPFAFLGPSPGHSPLPQSSSGLASHLPSVSPPSVSPQSLAGAEVSQSTQQHGRALSLQGRESSSLTPGLTPIAPPWKKQCVGSTASKGGEEGGGGGDGEGRREMGGNGDGESGGKRRRGAWRNSGAGGSPSLGSAVTMHAAALDPSPVPQPSNAAAGTTAPAPAAAGTAAAPAVAAPAAAAAAAAGTTAAPAPLRLGVRRRREEREESEEPASPSSRPFSAPYPDSFHCGKRRLRLSGNGKTGGGEEEEAAEDDARTESLGGSLDWAGVMGRRGGNKRRSAGRWEGPPTGLADRPLVKVRRAADVAECGQGRGGSEDGSEGSVCPQGAGPSASRLEGGKGQAQAATSPSTYHTPPSSGTDTHRTPPSASTSTSAAGNGAADTGSGTRAAPGTAIQEDGVAPAAKEARSATGSRSAQGVSVGAPGTNQGASIQPARGNAADPEASAAAQVPQEHQSSASAAPSGTEEALSGADADRHSMGSNTGCLKPKGGGGESKSRGGRKKVQFLPPADAPLEPVPSPLAAAVAGAAWARPQAQGGLSGSKWAGAGAKGLALPTAKAGLSGKPGGGSTAAAVQPFGGAWGAKGAGVQAGLLPQLSLASSSSSLSLLSSSSPHSTLTRDNSSAGPATNSKLSGQGGFGFGRGLAQRTRFGPLGGTPAGLPGLSRAADSSSCHNASHSSSHNTSGGSRNPSQSTSRNTGALDSMWAPRKGRDAEEDLGRRERRERREKEREGEREMEMSDWFGDALDFGSPERSSPAALTRDKAHRMSGSGSEDEESPKFVLSSGRALAAGRPKKALTIDDEFESFFAQYLSLS